MNQSSSFRLQQASSRNAIILGVALIGAALLGTLVVRSHLKSRAESNLKVCEAHLKNISVALDMYAKEQGGAYPQSLQVLVPSILPALPQCPAPYDSRGQWVDTYSSSYRLTPAENTEGASYSFHCQGDNHPGLVEANFPAFHSKVGPIRHPEQMPAGRG
jgi:hypothetical protein